MVKVAVCDDEEAVLPYLTSQIRSAFEHFRIQADIASYTSPLKLKNDVLEKKHDDYEVYFLDIDMPEMNGFALASLLADKLRKAFLIFISARNDYVFSCFSHHPFSFVRKDNLRKDLENTVRDLKQSLDTVSGCDTITLVDEHKHAFQFSAREVSYIEAQDKYICIRTLTGSQLIRSSLSAAERALKDTSFMRIHKSYLVNLHSVYSISYDQVILDDRTELPVGRGKVQQLKQRFGSEV